MIRSRDSSHHTPNKQQKLDDTPSANVIIQFISPEGDTTGPQLDVPHNVTPQQLETLLNGLLQQSEERTPFSFFIEEKELAAELGAHLQRHAVSVETVLRVVYQPQAIFRVRPVSRCSATIPGHTEAVLTVNFSPHGKRVASGGGDTTVRFWDLTTQTPQHCCKGHTAWVLVVSWSPDASMVASGDHAGAIWIWNPVDGKPLGQCKGHRKFVSCISWEPAHKSLPSKRFCSGSRDNTVRVWDATTRRMLYSMSAHTAAVTALRWGGDDLIYSAARDCTIKVWSAVDGRLVRNLQGHGHWVNTMSLSTDYALRTGAYDHTGAAPREAEHASKKAQERYDAAKGGVERMVTGSDDFTLCLWEPGSNKHPIARMTGHQQLVNQVSFSPDGRWIASASFDKSVKLWDGVKGAFVASLRGHVGPVYQVSWSSDSRLLVSGSKDSTLKVWDMRTKKVLIDLPGHADEVYSVDWSPDGGAVGSGGKDRVLKLWRQ